MKVRDGYESYLLRFQRVQKADRAAWLASTQSTTTGELRRFPNLDALIAFLSAEYGSGVAGESGDPSSAPQ